MSTIKGKNRSETALITECIKTAGEFAFINALYAADPSGDDFCHKMSTRHSMFTRTSMARLAKIKAASLLALSAKARLARAAVDDELDMMEDSLAAFLRSFIAETIELIDPLVREQRFAEEKAARTGVQQQNGPARIGEAA